MSARKFIATTLTCAAIITMSAQAWAKSGGGSKNADPEVLPTNPVYSVLEESVSYTGQTHLVMIYDSGVFPRRTYASKGDRIMFVNMSGEDMTLISSDDSWSTGKMSDGGGYLLLVQNGVDTDFEGGDQSCGKYSCTFAVHGSFEIDSLPAKADYWDAVMPLNDLISEHGVPSTLLNKLLTAVAAQQKLLGITKLVTG
ncbi:hypothetical protein [Pseudooceanicola sp. LIPI14-2-Ac024]|uniref:hypothetical protein n=1 Tax=Pseudooceanicola sp. LIPI14-2-Ac024 TaxID=3344875 RepID=UPI0035D0AF00